VGGGAGENVEAQASRERQRMIKGGHKACPGFVFLKLGFITLVGVLLCLSDRTMDERVVAESTPKWRLLMLLEKAQSVVRFASPLECDSIFVELASFTEQALVKKQKVRDTASRVSLEELLKGQGAGAKNPSAGLKEDEELEETSKSFQRPCSPFGVCDVSLTNAALCACCDDGTATSNAAVAAASGAGDVEACALCLCLLQHEWSLGLMFK
jgi:hypothetical protein